VNKLADQELLRDYATRRSEAAFAELVRRHVDFVYSAALRMVCDVHLAEDVTQGTFVALAQNARQLATHPVLSGWLHRTAQNLAANAVRSEVRRRAREQESVAMNQLLATEEDAPWEMIAPHLDAALGELNEVDRDAVLLRYFERKSARDMAEVLGTSEDAAQKRVSRAVEHLREFFSKRNVTIGVGGLAVLISANAVQSAPVGLAVTISAAVALTTTNLGMTMIYKIVITGMTAAAIGIGIYAVHLQKQIGALQQQQTLLNQQIAQLTQERDDAKNQLAALQQENEQLHANEIELLKLRGEITQLRRQQNISPAAAPSETNLPDLKKIQILLKSQIVSIPAEDLQILGVGWTSEAQGNKSGLLTEQQFKTISEALQGASDVNVISAPRVVTINGETATISVTRAFPMFSAGDTNANSGVNNTNVGTSLNVSPFFSTNSSTFTLNLNAKLNQLTGDPSQPNVQTIQLTNQVTLSPGQTFIFEQEIPIGNWLPDSTNIPIEPRSLLMFVTPTVVNGRDFQKRQ
jgi:RNA polymerase sigma factor (sigma-70 family)